MAATDGSAQPKPAWFADGYHGGVYGHYPPGYTAFLVEQLNRNPDWKINLEIEPETWDMARTYEPEAYATFKNLVEAGQRVEVVNPSYAQSYFFQSSGESVIRQFGCGIRKMREHFPNATFSTYSSEEPCFTSCLPPVLRSFGFEFAVLKNPNTCWGGYTTAYGGELVNWIGPDGSSILAVPRYQCEALHPTEAWSTLAARNSPEYIKACFEQGIEHPVGMCLQDAGWRNGPWLNWEGKNHYRPSVYTLWSDYIRNVTAGKTTNDWKFSQEDVRPGLMWGAQVLQRMAQQSRASEHRLLVAEKLAAMARIESGRPGRTNGFDEAWHGVLLSQHHDCWIVPYNGRLGNTWADQVRRWTTLANASSDLAVETALGAMLRSEGRQRGRAARLFNPTGSELDAVVPVPIRESDDATGWISRDTDGREFATQVVASDVPGQKQLLVRAKLPPVGYTTVEFREGKTKGLAQSSATLSADGAVLESDLFKIRFDKAKGGTIGSLIAKTQSNREFVDTKSERRFNELRGHFYEQGGFRSSADEPARIEVVEKGPLRATIKIFGRIAGSPFVQSVSLVQGSPVIDCKLRIDWQGNPRIGEFEEKQGWGNFRRPAYDSRFKLLALFPTAIEHPTLTKDAPYDVCESKNTDSFYNSWEKIKHDVILDWVDVAEKSASHGLAIFSDHTTSYAHGPDHPLGLTIQYAGRGLWARDYKVEGATEIRYAIVPHAGRWDAANLPLLAAAWQEPPIGAQGRGGPTASRSFIEPSSPAWQIPAMFEREESIFVRLFNAGNDSTPGRLKLGFNAGTVELVELDGRVIRRLNPGTNRTIELSMPSLGFQTLRLSQIQPPQPQ